ncbi:cutinase [Thraustotheca clavata]|uniref:Cutinase n=1 Tax=Thraustotheca clavata TaxID=74557 RepID=A0A1V9ZQ17_9STRA|nr:cutinase [Thraustotheca clavata]
MVSILSTLLGLALFATASNAAECTDVHVVFARGSGEMPGFGICGTPLVSGIKNNLSGMTVSSYAVNYLADYMQTSAGSGATDMTKHIVQIAKDCPNTSFVIGGYSQGASVTDIAIGIKTLLGTGQTIPTDLAPRIKAVVTFGNPLKLYGKTIAQASQLYGSKSIDFCNLGDPVCANGFNGAAHLAYPIDGSVTKAAQQAAAKVKDGSSKSKNLRVENTTTELSSEDDSDNNSNDSSDSNNSSDSNDSEY